MELSGRQTGGREDLPADLRERLLRAEDAGLARAEIARCFGVLDEHTANLDPATAHQIERLTQQVIEGRGLTALAVSQSMREALRLGRRTLVRHAGEVALDIDGEGRRGLTADDLMARCSRIRNVPAIG